MGKDSSHLKNLKQNGLQFLKLRAVELAILIYLFSHMYVAWFYLADYKFS